eukprot:2273405-Prorocentrum_lima.AAC.1
MESLSKVLGKVVLRRMAKTTNGQRRQFSSPLVGCPGTAAPLAWARAWSEKDRDSWAIVFFDLSLIHI